MQIVNIISKYTYNSGTKLWTRTKHNRILPSPRRTNHLAYELYEWAHRVRSWPFQWTIGKPITPGTTDRNSLTSPSINSWISRIRTSERIWLFRRCSNRSPPTAYYIIHNENNRLEVSRNLDFLHRPLPIQLRWTSAAFLSLLPFHKKNNAIAGNRTRAWSVAGTYLTTWLLLLPPCLSFGLFLPLSSPLPILHPFWHRATRLAKHNVELLMKQTPQNDKFSDGCVVSTFGHMTRNQHASTSFHKSEISGTTESSYWSASRYWSSDPSITTPLGSCHYTWQSQPIHYTCFSTVCVGFSSSLVRWITLLFGLSSAGVVTAESTSLGLRERQSKRVVREQLQRVLVQRFLRLRNSLLSLSSLRPNCQHEKYNSR